MSGDGTLKELKIIHDDIDCLIAKTKDSTYLLGPNDCDEFFRICDKISYNANRFLADDKKNLSLKLVKLKTILINTSDVFKGFLKDTQNLHAYNRSREFIKKYIDFRKINNPEIDHFRDFIQKFRREHNFNEIKFDNDKTLAKLYDETFYHKGRGNIEQYKDCLKQIKKFIDEQAFKHFVILKHSINTSSLDLSDPIVEDFRAIRKTLFDGNTLVYPDKKSYQGLSFDESLFSREYKRFFNELFTRNYGDVFDKAENNFLFNQFNISNVIWLNIVRYFPDRVMTSIFHDVNHKQKFEQNLYQPGDQPIEDNEDFFPFSGYDKKDEIKKLAPIYDLSFFSFFKRSAAPQEKPVIADHPDHPENNKKPVIVAHPNHPEKGKPRIINHGEMPDTFPKNQIADRSQELEDIKNMYHLPPSEALEDKTLSEVILAYGFIKSIPLLRKSTTSLLSKSFISLEKLFSSSLPKFSFSYNISSKGINKKSTQPTHSLMSEGGGRDGLSSNKNGSSDTKPKPKANVKKSNLAAKGGFILTGVTVGLEVLHARLKNAGYKRAASFVPVTSNFRPWGEAYFSTVDYNLGVDPAAGYSTTRLFTHAADATAYVFEGIGNIFYSAGEAERFIYRSFLNKKTTGFDTGHLGIINGTSEAVGSFIDCMGGSLNKRRLKAQAEFKSNISSYETPSEKKVRVKKLCIDRGLSHLPKDIKMSRIKKIRGTYAQARNKVNRSLLHDYVSSMKCEISQRKKEIPVRKDPLKAKIVKKPTNCLDRSTKVNILSKPTLPKRYIPKLNKSVAKDVGLIASK